MNVKEIRMLFAYNAWANNRLFESLAQLPEDLFLKDLKASHGGIRGTLTHLVAAEKLWLSRWLGKPDSAVLSVNDVPSLTDLKGVWEDVASRTARFIGRLDDQKLQSPLEYTSLTGAHYSTPCQHALQHLVNHSTYHRGQVAAMMRQVGCQPLETDLILFYRLTAQPSQKR